MELAPFWDRLLKPREPEFKIDRPPGGMLDLFVQNYLPKVYDPQLQPQTAAANQILFGTTGKPGEKRGISLSDILLQPGIEGMEAIQERDPSIAAAAITSAAFPPGASRGTTLTSRARKLPPVVSVVHGTPSPVEYTRPRLPPPEHDLGIHATISPNVSERYSDVGAPTFSALTDAYPRTKPFLMDARSALKFPDDPVKWNVPENVIKALEDHMRTGFVAPRGLLSDMKSIGSSEKMWQKEFIPMLKSRGHDSVWYPHYDDMLDEYKYNTFMAFDPEQLTPRFSPEGQALIRERGLREHIDGTYESLMGWKMPKGILAPLQEKESFSRAPTKNTFRWWEDINSPMSMIEKKYLEKYMSAK